MKKFGLIGGKLAHSYSLRIHRMFGSYEYDLCETSPGGLEALLNDKEYAGFNVTIPYKQTVMRYCKELSENARQIGAVNTILRARDGSLRGENTDCFGFFYLLKEAGIDVRGRKCTVLGNGGASLTVQAALRKLGAGRIAVISRKGEDNYENISKYFDSEILINTTPVGMFPNNGERLLKPDDFKNCKGVADVVYNPYRTQLILDAESKKIPAAGGLTMLVAQAKRASELFQDRTIPEEKIKEALTELQGEVLNLVLIGMPGSGKTFLGKKMALEAGKSFVDTDERIVQREGMSIPEIFEKKGEEYFRQVETEALREVCSLSGLIIATGGGVVTKERNRDILRQNGRIIWVRRELSKLETKGRPLLAGKGVFELYEERKRAYEEWSDFQMENQREEK